ncbi:MAG: hypothetical protein IKE41_02570 [Clostridia bacterium]|nr:hypothetical protein [Clostridia bacterium]MBR2734850.1 hypothetical protein [Clostridia bacterium]
MKNIIKKVLGIAIAFCLAVVYARCIDLGKPVMNEETSFTTKVSSNLKREEHRRIIKYEYEGKLNSNPFRYITVKNVISYVSRATKEVLAEFTVLMKFRYNEKTKEAECLSTSYGSIAKDADYAVSVSARKANHMVAQGAGMADIEFKYRGDVRDKFTRKISCNYLGNINISDC